MDGKPQVIAVTGPTATGKTALGIDLAMYYGGEIVSCDSMQIYRGLPIGTAQPSPQELAQVPHHLVGFLDVSQTFSVSDYVNLASETIQKIAAQGKPAVLVGGTGLYARSLLRGFSFEENCRNEALRQDLFRTAENDGADKLYQTLKELDPKAAEEIHPHNVKRVIRALEYCLLLGEPFSAQAERSKYAESRYRWQMICLFYRDRQKLYDRIDARVDKMMEAGLLEEARSFYLYCCQAGTPPTASQAIGYKELFPFFRGEVSLEEAVAKIKQESRRYAKRQIAWFSREKEACILYVDEFENSQEVFQEAKRSLRERGFSGKEGKPL